VTLVTDPAITALAAINLFRYATIPTAKTLASYATTFVAIILPSYATICLTNPRFEINDLKLMIWNLRLLMITNAYQPRFEISDY
jgi:hypothetical protein